MQYGSKLSLPQQPSRDACDGNVLKAEPVCLAWNNYRPRPMEMSMGLRRGKPGLGAGALPQTKQPTAVNHAMVGPGERSGWLERGWSTNQGRDYCSVCGDLVVRGPSACSGKMRNLSCVEGLPTGPHCQAHSGLHRHLLLSLALASLGTDNTQVTDGNRSRPGSIRRGNSSECLN